MKGDFSRVTFDPRHHYSQVFLQQGRVTLDADPNEQGAILLHVLRTMARDLFGPYAGPVDNAGFALSLPSAPAGTPPKLAFSAGRYYVDGILCETDGGDYASQPHHRPAPPNGNDPGADPLRRWLETRSTENRKFWVYLDVWERHVTAVEQPWLREAALGGPDTCSRAQVVWQIRSLELEAILATFKQRLETLQIRLKNTKDERERAEIERWIKRIEDDMAALDGRDDGNGCAAPLDALRRFDLPELAARIDPGHRVDDPCVMSPESDYRGAENHLYRVEIHRGGSGAQASFKWSRDNGSVLAAWLSSAGGRIRLGNTRGFAADAWVELTNDDDDLQGRPGELRRILGVDGDELVLDRAPDKPVGVGAKARRWDQVERADAPLTDEGAVPVGQATASDPNWIDLEDGVQVRFAPDREYRSGDYWLFAARVATGRLAWPNDDKGDARLQMPRGIEHHYAPLGGIGLEDGVPTIFPCTCEVHPVNTCGLLNRRQQDGRDIVKDPAGRAEPPPAPVAPPVPKDAAAVAKPRARVTKKPKERSEPKP